MTTPSAGKEREGQNCDTAAGPVYLHEVLRLAVRSATRRREISADQLCDMVGETAPESALTPENLRHLTNDRPATFTNPLGLVVVMARLGEPELLARMARASGYLLVPKSETNGTAPGLLNAAAEAQRETAEALEEVSKALLDGKMTRRRAADCIREIAESETSLAALERAVRAAMATQKADA